MTGPLAAPPTPGKKGYVLQPGAGGCKKKLEQALQAEKLPDGRTVKQALADNPGAATDFSAILFVVQPDETRYLPDGTCEVTIFFDRNRPCPIISKNPATGGGHFNQEREQARQ